MDEETKIVERIILTLQSEAKKFRKELEFHSIRDAKHLMEGYHRAIGIVRRFETKERE